MTRIEDAKKFRKQGLSFKEIATKMGIKKSTVRVYVYMDPPFGANLHKKKQFGKRVRVIIREELKVFGLPSEWEDELMKMFVVYHYSTKTQIGVRIKIDVQSLIQLLCRRYKVPTPRKLEILTYQGRGNTRKTCGYSDALQALNGVVISKPIDYVKHFIKNEGLSEEEILRAEELIEKIPKVNLQSRNPRVLAGAVLYEIHKPTSIIPRKSRIYTQRYISDVLQITSVALRNNWVKFFKSKQITEKGKEVLGKVK